MIRSIHIAMTLTMIVGLIGARAVSGQARDGSALRAVAADTAAGEAGDSEAGENIIVLGQNRARIEAAIEERRLVLIKQTDASRPEFKGPPTAANIVQGYVFGDHRLVEQMGVECHVNPAFLWIVVDGSESIIDHKVVLDLPRGAQAILGFYVKSPGDPEAGEPDTIDRFYYVDSLHGSGNGAYQVQNDEIAKLFRVSRHGQQLIMTPVAKSQYVCRGDGGPVPKGSVDAVRDDQRKTRYLASAVDGGLYPAIKTAFRRAKFVDGQAILVLDAATNQRIPRGTALFVNEDRSSADRMNAFMATAGRSDAGPVWLGCSDGRRTRQAVYAATINCGQGVAIRPMRVSLDLPGVIPSAINPFDRNKYQIESRPTGAKIIVGERALGPMTNNPVSLFESQIDELRLEKKGYHPCYRSNMIELPNRPLKTFQCDFRN